MNPRRQLSELMRRRRGWLIPAALLAFVPKCVLCVLAYVGLGTALGLGGPELCGVTAEPAGHWAWRLAMSGAALGTVALHLLRLQAARAKARAGN